MPDKYHSLLRLFRRLLQKNRFIRKLTHTGLSRSEIHVMVELQSNPNLTISGFIPMLGLDQSTVSRIVQGLVKNKWLEVNSAENDKRQKIISITKEGKNLINEIDKVAAPIFDQFSNRLNSKERDLLAEVFCFIADKYGQPSTNPRPGEKKLRTEQRRVSRAFGVLGSNLFGSNLTSSQWHVLAEITQRTKPITAKEISHLLGIAQNSISVILEKFEKEFLIRRKTAEHDSRMVELAATEKGRQYFEKIEALAANQLKEILSGFKKQDLSEIEDLLTKYVGEGEAKESVLNSLSMNYEVHSLKNPSEIKDARAFAINKIVNRGHQNEAPEVIVSSKSKIVGLYEISGEKNLKALAEVFIDGKNAILNLLCWSSDVNRNTLYSFIVRVKDKLEISDEIKRFTTTFQPAKEILEQ